MQQKYWMIATIVGAVIIVVGVIALVAIPV